MKVRTFQVGLAALLVAYASGCMDPKDRRPGLGLSGEVVNEPSIYYGGGEWPDKYWNSNVSADPRVRLEMGGKIYEREAVVVEDPVEFQTALQALAAKYPFWQEMLAKPESERPDMSVVRMDPRSL